MSPSSHNVLHILKSIHITVIDKCDKLFVRADQTNLTTRSATGPLNLRQQAARLEVRRNFFSIRVVEEWNKIPSTIKMASSVTSFKNRYKKHRADMVVPT